MIPSRAAELSSLVQRGKEARDAGNWQSAIALYATANEIDGARYDIKHNLGLSLIAANRANDGWLYLTHALALKPDLWPSHVLKAKVLRDNGQIEDADSVLTHVLQHDARNGHALLAAADLDMNEFGDAVGARERVAPLLSDPAFRDEAELTTLMSKLYDRDESDAELSYMLMDFAKRKLSMPGFKFSPEAIAGVTNRTGRKRIGLLSPMFCVSPVYFLTISTFRDLAKSFDLIILNRGAKDDWGTKAFRQIAAEWHNVQNVDPETLANLLKKQSLDVLFDLGGWSDPIGLKALSAKPAEKMYKWVGGQSATTGLTTFDGFITDAVQSPDGAEHFHSEPLLRAPESYVSFEANFPEALTTEKTYASNVAGVIGNPAKISRKFLKSLGKFGTEERPAYVFIDRRYAHARVRRRLEEQLRDDGTTGHIITVNSRAQFLGQVAKLHTVLDTYPYSGGLTTLEALHLGAIIKPASGNIASARHSLSHVFHWSNGAENSGAESKKKFLSNFLSKIISSDNDTLKLEGTI